MEKLYNRIDSLIVAKICIKTLSGMRKERIYKKITIAWKVSKYGGFSGTYFPVFGLNAGKYGPEKTPYLDIFHAVYHLQPFRITETEAMKMSSFLN